MEYHLEARVDVPLLQEDQAQARQKEEDYIVDMPDESHVPQKTTEESHVPKKATEENQNQDTGKHISRVHRSLVRTDSDAYYKPELISIGPYHIEDPDLENSIKKEFQKSFCGKGERLKKACKKRLTDLKGRVRSWYTENIKRINDDQFVDMLLLDGCFILEFFNKIDSDDASMNDDGEVPQTVIAFMNVDGKVAKTLTDLLLFENQLPFFVLFELHKLKSCYSDDALPESDHHQNDSDNDDALPESDYHQNDNDNDEALLNELIVLVKKCFSVQVPKFTPQNVVAHEYKLEPEHLPRHLLEVVHSLCIPINAKSDNDLGGAVEQINTATELEKDGVSFEKIGKVYKEYNDKEGPNYNANDCTTLFDIDFNNRLLKIPCFIIEGSTKTFLRNMIAYEQHSTDARKYFTDFASFMDQLIDTSEYVNLLRRRGIIVNLLGIDQMVTEMFNNLDYGVSSNTFAGVISKVNRHGEKAWNIWIGKLRQDFYYSPWKLISTVVGGLIISLGTVVSIKSLLE